MNAAAAAITIVADHPKKRCRGLMVNGPMSRRDCPIIIMTPIDLQRQLAVSFAGV